VTILRPHKTYILSKNVASHYLNHRHFVNYIIIILVAFVPSVFLPTHLTNHTSQGAPAKCPEQVASSTSGSGVGAAIADMATA
jgi:hypothetical protein